jgi:two-component system, NtrC family, response regulator HydG
MWRVLVVDDDQVLREGVRDSLAVTNRFTIEESFDGVNAIDKVKNNPSTYNLVLLDVDMPRMNGLDTLKAIKELDPSIIVIIMTAYATIDDAVKSVKYGAYNYISKPVKGDSLVNLIDKALAAHSLISEVAASAPVLTMEAGRKIIGHTAQMQKVFFIIDRLSKVDTPVLIRGASGTGKELVARAIHANSAQKDGPFVAVNCSAIPENLFESEFFGHEKGSFTGAEQRKIGKFQFAENGTLFLDEMGDLPLMMQVKLLRVLQEKSFTPVGANREIESNVRVIAATNRPLEEMIKNGSFREDLYYRLNVMPINLPSLNERRDDIPNLVNGFVQKFNRRQGKRILGVTPEAMKLLQRYDWPGNIRELENVIEHAFILEEGPNITMQTLPEKFLVATGMDSTKPNFRFQGAAAGSTNARPEGEDAEGDLDSISADEAPLGDSDMVKINGESLDFNRHKEAFEREFIIKALKLFKGRINQTALHANIPKKTLLRKIEKYGIVPKDYANQE